MLKVTKFSDDQFISDISTKCDIKDMAEALANDGKFPDRFKNGGDEREMTMSAISSILLSSSHLLCTQFGGGGEEDFGFYAHARGVVLREADGREMIVRTDKEARDAGDVAAEILFEDENGGQWSLQAQKQKGRSRLAVRKINLSDYKINPLCSPLGATIKRYDPGFFEWLLKPQRRQEILSQDTRESDFIADTMRLRESLYGRDPFGRCSKEVVLPRITERHELVDFLTAHNACEEAKRAGLRLFLKYKHAISSAERSRNANV